MSSIPTTTATKVLKQAEEDTPKASIEESIQGINRLSHIMESQVTTPPPSTHAPTQAPTSTLAATTTTLRMTAHEKSIANKNLKEKAEAETFIRNFAAAQQDERLVSVTDPWFVNLVAEFRAMAKKERDAREMEELLRMSGGRGGKKKKNKVKRGRGFKGWLVSMFWNKWEEWNE